MARKTICNTLIKNYLKKILLINICLLSGLLISGCHNLSLNIFKAKHHQVEPGETLYTISKKYNVSYIEIAKINKIDYPFTIHQGQNLALPNSSNIKKTKPQIVNLKNNSNNLTNNQNNNSNKTYNNSQLGLIKPQPKINNNLSWVWPAQGTLLDFNASKQVLKNGINLSGKLGAPIYCANSGKVVYSGNALRGYGNLIIIKHANNYLTAYAHNNKNLVKENQQVTKGQKIAEMGNSGADRIMLHFEVRHNGEPINPLTVLPKRS